MPMLDAIIKKVNNTCALQNSGRELAFKNRKQKDSDWDEVPQTDDELQGLLERDLPFPDIAAKMPGVDLESHMIVTAFENEPEPNMETRANNERCNADINPHNFCQPPQVEANPEEIVIDIELPDKISGVYAANATLDNKVGPQNNNPNHEAGRAATPAAIANDDNKLPTLLELCDDKSDDKDEDDPDCINNLDADDSNYEDKALPSEEIC